MADNSAEFVGNFILRGKFECLTGLHIGGSKEKLEIGGVDSPVVRNPRDRFPYVPGSSLKGKLRSLLEFGLGKVPIDKKDDKGYDITGNVSDDPAIVRIFGIGVDDKEKAENQVQDQLKANQEAVKNGKPEKEVKYPPLFRVGPSRLVVRDCHPDEHTKNWWKTLDTDLLYTEYKSENGINRITSAANPRFIERVAAGSRFEFEMVYSVFKIAESNEAALEAANADLDNLRMALLMLEHNFIGKSGSRGYGRIQFHLTDPVWVSNADYRNGGNNFNAAFAPLPTEVDGLKRLGEVQFEIPKAASN